MFKRMIQPYTQLEARSDANFMYKFYFNFSTHTCSFTRQKKYKGKLLFSGAILILYLFPISLFLNQSTNSMIAFPMPLVPSSWLHRCIPDFTLCSMIAIRSSLLLDWGHQISVKRFLNAGESYQIIKQTYVLNAILSEFLLNLP